MKKLMFLAVVAAATVASAVTCVTTKGHWEKGDCGEKEWIDGDTYAGTAHKVTITLKTTDVKSTTKKNKSECSESCTYYRVQATKKINGLVWEQLEDCTGCVPMGSNSAFWTKDEAIDAEFAIAVGRIGKSTTSKTVEAYGTLSGEEFGDLAWAGFGSMTGKNAKEGACGDVTDCVEYVKSISGGIAGALIAPEYNNPCAECDPIEYAGCCEDMGELAGTAAYGTIKISYDNATAKKVAVAEDAEDVASFVKLPAAVADEIVVNEVQIEE